MDIRKIRWKDVDWMKLAQNKAQLRFLVNTVMNNRFP